MFVEVQIIVLPITDISIMLHISCKLLSCAMYNPQIMHLVSIG